MDKRYQVFISSTYLDLKEERQAVSQALLRSDCFPAQMENWPAMDAEQMEAIKEIIDQSDYYVVISAGKYGSISPETGLSYTEMEYDYAVEIGKPIIRLLHKDPFSSLKGSQIEETDDGKSNLRAFHEKLKKAKVCSFWENPDQLKNETILALVDIKKRKPSFGWVRSMSEASAAERLENSRLKEQLNELQSEILTLKSPSVRQHQIDGWLGKLAIKLDHANRNISANQIISMVGRMFEGAETSFVKAVTMNEGLAKSMLSDEEVEACASALVMDELIWRDNDGDFVLSSKGKEEIDLARLNRFIQT